MTLIGEESQVVLSIGEPKITYDKERTARYRAASIAWVVGATIVRFRTIADLPLGNGEAYYATWSRFLDWSYYDHPPLLAWMVWLTTLFGSSPATVRLVPVLCAAAFGFVFSPARREAIRRTGSILLACSRYRASRIHHIRHRPESGGAPGSALGRLPACLGANERARRMVPADRGRRAPGARVSREVHRRPARSLHVPLPRALATSTPLVPQPNALCRRRSRPSGRPPRPAMEQRAWLANGAPPLGSR